MLNRILRIANARAVVAIPEGVIMPDPHTNGQGDWRDIVVSIVPNAWETKTTDISLGAALEKIRSGRWAKPVARIRGKYVRGARSRLKRTANLTLISCKGRRKPLKRELHGVTFSGRFKVRAATS